MYHFRERDYLLDILQNTFLNFVRRVPLTQLVETEVTISVRRFQGRIFQRLAALALCFELVAHFTHHPQKVALGGGGEDGPVNVGPDGAPVGGLAVLLRLPFGVVLGPPAGVLYHGNGVLPAKPV